MSNAQAMRIPIQSITPVLGDGAVAIANVGGGRLIPALIIDCTHRQDVVETVRLHEHLGAGDIESIWAKGQAKPFKNWYILNITFIRPTRVQLNIPLDPLSNQIGVVDSVMQAGAVYIIPGEPGQARMRDVENAPRILTEIAATEIGGDWDDLFLDWRTKQIRRETKLSRREARARAREVNKKWRELSTFRMPQADNADTQTSDPPA